MSMGILEIFSTKTSNLVSNNELLSLTGKIWILTIMGNYYYYQHFPFILTGAVKAAAICNGENKMLYCKPSEKIKVNYAFYGKRNGHDCHGPLPYRDESPTCSALDAKYNVQSFCEGKPTCMLKADDATYGRALCPNVNKYLYVTYYCEDSPSFKERSALLSPAMDLEEDAVSRSLIRRLPGKLLIVSVVRHQAFRAVGRKWEARGSWRPPPPPPPLISKTWN